MKKTRAKRSRKEAEFPPGAPPSVSPSSIRVRGARVHNLRNVDVDLPRDRLVVLTGVSGSGKSSLAFDTIYAEGQRRYLECLSTYARQFLDQLERPDVDAIEGLPPTVAIDQKAGTPNPRSTLGTITEIYDYLRLLFARAGTPHCPRCDATIHRQTPEQMADQLMALPTGRKVQLLAPLVRDRKGQHLDVFQAIRSAGLIRARVDGQMVEVTDTPPKLVKTKSHTIEAVIDRLVIREGIRPRLAESLDLALKLADGRVLVLVESPAPDPSSPPAPGWEERLLSVHLACPACGTSLAEIEPRSFSFNSPHGACPACDGLGSRPTFLAELSVPDRSRSWSQGAVIPLTLLAEDRKDPAALEAPSREFLTRHGLDVDAPLSSWPAPDWQAFWHGEPGGPFPGIAAMLESADAENRSEALRRALDVYREPVVCPACDGSRLRPEARAVRFGGRSIRELTAMAVEDVLAFVDSVGWVKPTGSGPESVGCAELGSAPPTRQSELPFDAIAAPLLAEIAGRLRYLIEVGLEYLALGRGSDTLSGGELQRARLAAQLGSGLVGVCYILDEPTAGLHPRDTARLIASLRRLQEMGNSVLVVEHDEAMIRAADWVVDLGPGAGPDGGAIVAAAPPDQLSTAAGSITAQYLNRAHAPPEAGDSPGRASLPASREEDAARTEPRPPEGGRARRFPREGEPPGEPDAQAARTEPRPPEGRQGRLARSPGWIEVRGAAIHNLQHVDARIPLGTLTCVAGVSGSGKSSLVHDVLARSVRRALHRTSDRPVAEDGIVTISNIDRLIEVDQTPIGRTPRSTPATATGLFDDVRRVFAMTREARIRGYGASRFSFNARGGRCEVCLGLGHRRIPMQYLPDLYVTCEECNGRRYNRQTLEVRFKGKSIGEMLELRVDEALALFDAVPRVLAGLEALHDVGLGYLTLGQASTTLSGGEAQRVKLAADLGRPAPAGAGGRALYILDEPTTGLHFADIDRLLRILHRLVDLGHTVLVIEHHLDVIASADWVIDLGPEAGAGGGRVVAIGPPDAIAAASESHTGRALRAARPEIATTKSRPV